MYENGGKGNRRCVTTLISHSKLQSETNQIVLKWLNLLLYVEYTALIAEESLFAIMYITPLP